MTNLITQPTNALEFMFEGNEVRVVRDDKGEPWFVAKDVAETLGYVRARDAISQHCKGAVKHRLLTSGGEQELTIIPERDVYRLVMRSKLEGAEKFEEWVVGEVLPAIRKTGSYSLQPKPMTQIELILATAQVLADVEKRLVATEEHNKQVQGAVAKHESKFIDIESDLEDVKNTNILDHCPTHAESITAIRERMNKMYDLSMKVVDEVMRQSPLSLKPAHTIRNTNPSAKGSSYFVYHIKDVNKVFALFASQAEMVSVGRYKHPFIEGKFKMSK